MKKNLKIWVIIGEKIKHARIESGMLQKELAAKIGMSQTHISRIESGELHCSIYKLHEIAKTLNKKIILDIV